MKKLIIIPLLFLAFLCYSQTKIFKNIRVTNNVILQGLKEDISPDSILTLREDSVQYSLTTTVTNLSTQSLADSLSINAVFDSLEIIKIKLNDSTWIIHSVDSLIFVENDDTLMILGDGKTQIIDTLEIESDSGAVQIYIDDTIRIVSSGTTDRPIKIGNGSIIIDTVGNITMSSSLVVNDGFELTNSVWKSWDIDPIIWTHPAVNSMDLTNEDNFSTLDADKATDESINYIWEVPAQYNPDDSVYIHLEYFVDGVCETDTSIVFGLEYKLLSLGNTFDFGSGTTTVLDTAVFTCTAKEILQRNGGLLFVPTGFVHEKHVLIRLFRDADNGEDNYNDDLRIISIHIDYKANRIGESP